jgi:hypothetical protein
LYPVGENPVPITIAPLELTSEPNEIVVPLSVMFELPIADELVNLATVFVVPDIEALAPCGP